MRKDRLKSIYASGAVLLSIVAVASTSSAVCASDGIAAFTAKNELLRPVGYREWIYIGAPLTPNDMNNGKAAFPEFHNVYMDPASWQHWKKTGKFRDGTMIVKELVSVASKSAASGKGYFMGEYIGLEAVVKDTARFPKTDGYWGFFRFTTDDHKKRLKQSKVMPSAACVACHSAKAAQDMIFTQHYPVLRDAKARGEQGIGGK